MEGRFLDGIHCWRHYRCFGLFCLAKVDNIMKKLIISNNVKYNRSPLVSTPLIPGSIVNCLASGYSTNGDDVHHFDRIISPVPLAPKWPDSIKLLMEDGLTVVMDGTKWLPNPVGNNGFNYAVRGLFVYDNVFCQPTLRIVEKNVARC